MTNKQWLAETKRLKGEIDKDVQYLVTMVRACKQKARPYQCLAHHIDVVHSNIKQTLEKLKELEDV